MVGVGFVATFGRNGTLNAVLGALGLGQVNLLFTLEAVVIAHAFYNAPLVARVTTAAWESVDASAVETARSLGASPVRAFRDVVAPQLYPSVLMGAALTFVFTFSTFPIVLALGGFQLATVEVFVYRLIRDLEYAEAAALALIELGISLGLLYAYLRYEAKHTVRSRGIRPLPRRPLTPPSFSVRELLPRLGLAVYAVVALAVFVAPIASMVLASLSGPEGLTLANYQFLIDRQTTGASFQVQPWDAVKNSLLFGVASLAVALPMGVVVAVLTTRDYRGRKLVDAVAMAPLAVSGIVVGLGLLRGLVFGVEVGGSRIAVGGSFAIVSAHAVAGYPFVVRTVAPGLEGVDHTLVESARALGAPRARALLDIELPLVWPASSPGPPSRSPSLSGSFRRRLSSPRERTSSRCPSPSSGSSAAGSVPRRRWASSCSLSPARASCSSTGWGVTTLGSKESPSDSAAVNRTAPPAVELDGVTRRYGETTAVEDLSLSVRDGEFFTLVGPSGCGKTTTLRLIAGFEDPTQGEVRFGGESVTGVPPEGRDVGVVFQNYALFPHMTVGENVAYGLSFSDPPGGGSDEARFVSCWSWWTSTVCRTGTQTRFPAASNSGWRWPARWPPAPTCSCSTSR